MKIYIISCLTILLTAFHSSANDFRYLQTGNGLPDGEINSIVQDSSGNMWFGTWTGLIKYDGYHFDVFRPKLGDFSSLPDKKIKKLFVDSKDNLWIATSAHLCRFNKKDNTFTTCQFEGFLGRPANIIQMAETEGILMVQTTDGFFCVHIEGFENNIIMLKRSAVIHNGQPLDLYFSGFYSTGNNIVLTDNLSSGNTGLVYISALKTADGKFILETDTLLKTDGWVNDAAFVPGEKTLYLATTKGIVAYATDRKHLVKNVFFKNKDVQYLRYASNYHIYAALSHPELLFIDLHTGTTGSYASNPHKAGSLTDNEIHCLYEDFSGNLWIGHQGQGISILDLYRKKFWSFLRDPFEESTLNSNTVMCFNGTESEIFIGCRSKGLNIVAKNQTTGNNTVFQSLPLKPANSPANISDGIWDIEKQSDSLFWLGTDMGLYRLLRTSRGWNLEAFGGEPSITSVVRKVFIDANHNIWCGTHESGLIFIPNLAQNPSGVNYSFGSETENPETLSDNCVLDIFLDSKKRFWVGTANGLNRLAGFYDNLDLSGNSVPELRFNRFIAHRPSPGYLNNNEINCIYENYDGNLWIATQGGGINILEPETGNFTHLTTDDGLPSNDIISMLPDEDGNLWISTSMGLARFNRFGNETGFIVFNTADGIQSEVFMINSSFRSADGQMFFGGDRGFTCFYPREIRENETAPKVSLTQFRIRNQVVEIGDTIHNGNVLHSVLNEVDRITLPYRSNNFSIGVSAIHFQNPDDNKITYILEGMFENWYNVPAGNRYVYLSNIPAGTYTFRAKAISSDGILSENERSMTIEILPPWYESRLAYVMYVLAVLFLSWVIAFLLNIRQKLVYQKEIDKIALENNENKMQFLTNIAHELRTPLSLVVAPVEDMVKNMNVDYKWKNHLSLISRNSNYLLRLINQIIDFRKLNAGKLVLNVQQFDIVKLIKDVVLNFKGIETSRNINLQVKVPAEPVLLHADAQKIEEVLYNLLSNAFKHTADYRSIFVTLDFHGQGNNEDKMIRITVFNEGKEIAEKDREKIFERFYKVDEKTEGGGIGLFFSRSLVEMHHGKIDVESLPGKGVAFHVYLPVQHEEIVPAEEPVPVQRVLPAELIQPGNGNVNREKQESSGEGILTVMIVEDNPELGEFLTGVFSREYQCILASNGEEAWHLIQKQIPDIIISDAIMPRMDGLELCRKVKENSDTCHIPVLLLTAKDSPEQITEGYRVGVDAYVTKPFDLNLLLSQTGRLIQNRALIREKYRTKNFMVEVDRHAASRDEAFIESVRRILDENISDADFNVNRLAKDLKISTTQLYRRMKDLTGHSPVEFIRIVKLQKAYGLLSSGSNTVKEVCYLTGFNNMSYFIKCFREQFGITPASFRDNGPVEKERGKAMQPFNN